MKNLKLYNVKELSSQKATSFDGGNLLEDIWYGIGYFAREGWEWMLEPHPTIGF